MTSSPLRTALIGVTGYGDTHYRMCMEAIQAGLISFDAVVIINPHDVPDKIEALRAIKCRIFESTEAMFATMKGQLDLVCIPTGIGTHAPFTLAALEAGAHVLVEKPAAGTVAEVDAMQEASRRTGKHVFVGFQDMYRPDLQEIKHKLIDNSLGHVKKIFVHGRWPRNTSYYGRNHWAGSLKSGNTTIYDSPANNAFAHYLNIAFFMSGSTFENSANVVKTEAECWRAYPIESFDTIVTRATTEQGTLIHYTVSHALDEKTFLYPDIIIETDSHKIIMGQKENVIEDLQGHQTKTISNADESRKYILPSIVAKIRGQKTFTCGLEIAKCHTQYIESLHKRFSIQDFPQALVQVISNGEHQQRVVLGLKDIMIEATRKGALFSELGFPKA